MYSCIYYYENHYTFTEELCHPSPCGPNTRCEVVNLVPTCKCLQGYHGSPLQGCRHECDADSDCGSHLSCIDFRCQNPCSACGTNADCVVRNHAAVCTCPKVSTIWHFLLHESRRDMCFKIFILELSRKPSSRLSTWMHAQRWLSPPQTGMFLQQMCEPLWWCMRCWS